MKRYTLFRLPVSFILVLVSASLLALAPQAALAQHGGGGHGGGGGHFGGGGGHFAGFGGHSSASSHSAKSGSHAKMQVFSGAPAKATTAQSTNAPASTAFSGSARPFSPGPAHATIGFPAASGATTFQPGTRFPGAPLSFSGEGHEIWQNPAPGSSGLFNARSGSGFIGSRPWGPLPIHRPFYPFFPGFGFGYSPFFGFCDPFDAWSFGCGGLGLGFGGYDGYGYGAGGYGYGSDSGSAPAWDNNAPAAPDNDNSGDSGSGDSSYDINAHNSWQNPPDATNGQPAVGAMPARPNAVIYLKDGSTYEITDYWVSENKLHYVTNYGGENAIDMSQLDMQRTVDANAARGTSFTLHPAQPAQLTPPPSNDNPAAAPPQQ